MKHGETETKGKTHLWKSFVVQYTELPLAQNRHRTRKSLYTIIYVQYVKEQVIDWCYINKLDLT